MKRIEQTPADPVGADSYSYDPELSTTPVAEHPTAIPRHRPSGFERWLVRIEASFAWCFRALMILTGLGLAALMFAQVIMRYVLESAFVGIEETAILLGVWIYFLGMGYATRVREHIHGGIVSLVFSDPFKIRLIRFVGSLICMVAACIFGFYASKYALFVIDKGRMSLYLQWPKGIWSASMIVGFGMMAGYFLLEAIAECRDLLKFHRQSQTTSTSTSTAAGTAAPNSNLPAAIIPE